MSLTIPACTGLNKQLLLTVVTKVSSLLKSKVVAQTRLKKQSANLKGGPAAPSLQWAAPLRAKQGLEPQDHGITA